MSFAGIALAVIIHYSLTGVQSATLATANSAPASAEKSCSESNITIDQVQFQHVWDLNGLASYMTRLEQWKPFIDLETKDVRFRNGVIGGYWNFQIVRNLNTGSRLTLCAVHTPDQRRPNHDRNFFFEFKVLVSLIPPPDEGTEIDITSTTTPESIASPTTTQPQTPEPVPDPSLSTTATTTTTTEATSTTTTTTSTTAPSTTMNPAAPAAEVDPSRVLFDEGAVDPFTNSIQQRSFGGAGFQRLVNATATGVMSLPLMMQFTPLGLPAPHRFPAPGPLFPSGSTGSMFMGRDVGSMPVSAKPPSGPSAGNVTLVAPTFQQSPISPKTHFTFWDFEAKTLQLIRSKYRNGQQVPQDAKIVLTFTMTELIVEKPHTERKNCA